jgi:hypothetical protein
MFVGILYKYLTTKIGGKFVSITAIFIYGLASQVSLNSRTSIFLKIIPEK